MYRVARELDIQVVESHIVRDARSAMGTTWKGREAEVFGKAQCGWSENWRKLVARRDEIRNATAVRKVQSRLQAAFMKPFAQSGLIYYNKVRQQQQVARMEVILAQADRDQRISVRSILKGKSPFENRQTKLSLPAQMSSVSTQDTS